MTTKAAALRNLTTDELIAEYDAACAARSTTSHTTYRARQLRISRAVGELDARADDDDQIALAWYSAAK